MGMGPSEALGAGAECRQKRGGEKRWGGGEERVEGPEVGQRRVGRSVRPELVGGGPGRWMSHSHLHPHPTSRKHLQEVGGAARRARQGLDECHLPRRMQGGGPPSDREGSSLVAPPAVLREH